MKIHSIRVKLTAFTVGVILAAALCIVSVCYALFQGETDRKSVEVMRLIGQDTQNKLDEFFVSIEQSVTMVANEAMDSMDSMIMVECGAAGTYAAHNERTKQQQDRLDDYLTRYCSKICETFGGVASHTLGSITYYYCINPEVSSSVHGFFYSRVGKAGFVEQEPIDASLLDPDDSAHTAWYYTAVERGRPSWVGPFKADLLNEMEICSYLVPIYSAGTLVGILGMDIPQDTLFDQVAAIRVYKTGFASLCDMEGRIYYHPELEPGTMPELSDISVSTELLVQEDSGDTLIRYATGGEKRQMSFSTLRNGMKLVLIAPVNEINSSWLQIIQVIVVVTAVAVVIFTVILLLAMGVITGPLRRLTAASRKLADADYDVELDYHGRDEVGELTEAFRNMRDQQKEYVDDLNRRVYTDDLTGLSNMRSFFTTAPRRRASILEMGKNPVMLYFNLIGLKHFNRQYGYEEGNRLIVAFSEVMKNHFSQDAMCRIGLDHFAAVSEEEGLEETLEKIFDESREINSKRTLPVRVGIYRDSTEAVDVSVACDRAKYACDLLRGSADSAFMYFRKEMHEQLLKARYIVNHLDQALSEHWIQVYYQPLVRAINGRVCDEEALSRWVDPEKGILSPGDFIPVLEGAGLIYKMDLYVLDQILEKMKSLKAEGLTVVPHSVNLSRSDFDACDIVEEIRTRVDAASVPHSKITIEITESIIGSDFEFMKEQVERFRDLGFPVWMDDFGSGYSSLDVLQSIRFDLIKFDMSFMRKLDEGEDGKIILSKLMEMANALGVDTVCEGVETEAQKQFLQEIGCSKLQGYYYCRPIPYSEILERYRKGIQIGFENSEEADYFETVGRVNLYDLGVIASDENDVFRNSFSTVPMCVIEVKEDMARFVRSNQSCRDFIHRFFGSGLSLLGQDFFRFETTFMNNLVKTCKETTTRSFYDELMPDGSTVHSFVRRIDTNPVTGSIAMVVAVLSISEPDETASYAEIARALAADYVNIYAVDLDTDKFIEYSSVAGKEELAMERHGEHFFALAGKEAAGRVYEEDRAVFLETFTKENVERDLDEQGVFTLTYRLIDTGVPVYTSMKITRMQSRKGKRIIIGISNIDAQMREKEQMESIQRERDALSRVMALSGDYLSLYSIDPDTGNYVEYNATNEYETLGLSKQGTDFFGQAAVNGKRVIWPEDLPEYLSRFTKENVLAEIGRYGFFQMRYRLNFHGKPRHVLIRVAPMKEGSSQRLVAGVREWRERRS